jgi:hypothetical protein
MKSESAFVGARGVDSYPFSIGGSAQQAIDLKKSGIDFFVGYLGCMNVERMKYILDAGLAFMPVTLAAAYNGKAAVQQCKGLSLPVGTTVWLDVEGKTAWETPAPELMTKINTWANDVASAGYVPGIYVGAPQPLSSKELYSLRVVRYWKGIGRTVDKTGSLAEPSCGWCMTQMYPSVHWAGVFVDVNIIGQDYKTRLPSWARK